MHLNDIDELLLIKYAESPDNLDAQTREMVESHLKNCESCKEEYKKCKKFEDTLAGLVENMKKRPEYYRAKALKISEVELQARFEASKDRALERAKARLKELGYSVE